MPKALTIKTQVDDDGHLPKEVRENIATYLTLFAGGDVQVTIGKPKRTISQNAHYHGFVIRPIHQKMIEVGLGPISHEALHCYFRDKYLSVTVEEVFGVEQVIQPSTTRLDSTEFHYFVEAIKNDEIVRQLGVVFPEPIGQYEVEV